MWLTKKLEKRKISKQVQLIKKENQLKKGGPPDSAEDLVEVRDNGFAVCMQSDLFPSALSSPHIGEGKMNNWIDLELEF